MDADKKEFLLHEYDRLTVEITNSLKETQNLERLALIASAIIWTWILTQKMQMVQFVKWMPMILVLLGGLRSLGLLKQIQSIGRYLSKVEREFGLSGELGWEKSGMNETLRATVGYIFWWTMLIINMLVPIIMEIEK